MRSTLFHRSCFLLSSSPLSATVDIISALPSFVNPFLTIFLSFLHYRQIFYIILYSILFLMPFHYYSAFYTLNPSSYTYICKKEICSYPLNVISLPIILCIYIIGIRLICPFCTNFVKFVFTDWTFRKNVLL